MNAFAFACRSHRSARQLAAQAITAGTDSAHDASLRGSVGTHISKWSRPLALGLNTILGARMATVVVLVQSILGVSIERFRRSSGVPSLFHGLREVDKVFWGEGHSMLSSIRSLPGWE